MQFPNAESATENVSCEWVLNVRRFQTSNVRPIEGHHDIDATAAANCWYFVISPPNFCLNITSWLTFLKIDWTWTSWSKNCILAILSLLFCAKKWFSQFPFFAKLFGPWHEFLKSLNRVKMAFLLHSKVSQSWCHNQNFNAGQWLWLSR